MTRGQELIWCCEAFCSWHEETMATVGDKMFTICTHHFDGKAVIILEVEREEADGMVWLEKQIL